MVATPSDFSASHLLGAGLGAPGLGIIVSYGSVDFPWFTDGRNECASSAESHQREEAGRVRKGTASAGLETSICVEIDEHRSAARLSSKQGDKTDARSPD